MEVVSVTGPDDLEGMLEGHSSERLVEGIGNVDCSFPVNHMGRTDSHLKVIF